MSTFAEIVRFEIRYRFRQWSTGLYFVAMSVMTWLLLVDLMIGEAAGSGTIHANAPATIAMVTTIGTMVMLIATAGLFGDAAARDVESRMHPLLYTKPLSKSAYLGGRFVGAFIVNALLLATGSIGLLFAELQRSESPELFGAFRAMAYVQPYFLIALPTLFATGAILFSVAASSGRTIASYVAAAFLFFGTRIAGGISETFATLADPFAFDALGKVTEYWTPFETNTRFVPLTGALLTNRLTWLAIGVTMLALTHVRFRLDDGERRRRRQERQRAKITLREDHTAIVIPAVSQAFGVNSQWQQVASIAVHSLRDVFLTRTVVLAVTVLLGLIVRAGFRRAGMVLDTPTWPMTSIVAREVLGGAGVVIVLIAILFAGQLIWRERDAGTSSILDAIPLPNWVSLTGKFCAMVLALTAVQALLMLGGIFLQWLEGYSQFEPLLYAKILFGMQLPEYVLWAAFAFFVHVLVNQKYAAHFIVVLYWAFCRFGRGALGVEHNLLTYTSDPGWSYSDISGFDPFLTAWLSFQLYWGAWALLLLVLAKLFWQRGRDIRFRERLRDAKAQLTTGTAFAMGFSTLAVLLSGGWVFYNTNIVNEYRTGDERQDTRAEYERLYKRYDKLPQPLITRCKLHVELEPARRALHVRGTYTLVNHTAKAVDSVHVLSDADVDTHSLVFDRNAQRVTNDQRHRYQIFKLQQPLPPGASMQMHFRVASAPRGFTNNRAGGEIVNNGSYFDRTWMPMIGYQPQLELTDDRARKDRGFAPRKTLPTRDDLEARQVASAINDTRWLQLETTIGTTSDQIAIAPGSLRRTWTANGRRYFHYVTDAPIQNIYAVYSAAYAVREDRWNGIDIQIFHHPRHTPNLDRIMRATKATLAYHSRNFGPYPHRVLRIVEFPRHRGTYARAYPTAVAFSEGFGFMARPEDGIDYPFLVAAHEVAHQWWGNQVRPARVEGSQVLNETLAHYGAMMVMEQEHGRKPNDQLRRSLRSNYLLGRRGYRSSEVPLVRSTDHNYLHYDKGALAMYALRDAIGEEHVNTALRRLFEKHRFGAPPFPTTRELYAELQAVTPEAQRFLLHDLFERITLWELRAKNARVERVANAYRVTLTVTAEKVEAEASGRDTRVPMDDLVEVGVFAGSAAAGDPGEPLYLQKHRIRSGEQTITITVPRAPARAGIDPYQKLIERDLEDPGNTNNLAELPPRQ